MKSSKVCLFILVIFLFSSLYIYSDEGVELRGKKVFLEKIVRDSSNRILSCYITKKETLRIGNYDFAMMPNSRIDFYKNGNFKSCTIGDDSIIKFKNENIKIRRGTKFRFYEEDEKINYRKSEILLSGENIITIRDTQITFDQQTRIFFLDDENIDFLRSDFYPARYTEIRIKDQKYMFKINKRLDFHENGIIRSGIISEIVNLDTRSGSFTIKPDTRLYYKINGNIDYEKIYVEINEEKILMAGKNEIPVKENAGLTFHKNSVIKSINGNIGKKFSIIINGHKVPLNENSHLEFENNGELNADKCTLILSSDINLKINNMNLTSGEGKNIFFYNDGTLKQITLSKGTDLNINKKIIPVDKDTAVYFFENGDIDVYKTNIILSKDFHLETKKHKIPVKKGTRIFLLADGNLNILKTKITLADDFSFNTANASYIFKKDTGLVFHKESLIAEGTLSKDAQVTTERSIIYIPKESTVYYSKKGYISHIKLAGETEVISNSNKYYFKKESILKFQPTGEVLTGTLSKDQFIKFGDFNLFFKAGTQMDFYKKGIPIITSYRALKDTEIRIGKYTIPLKMESTLYFKSDMTLDLEKSYIFLSEDKDYLIGKNNIKVKAANRLYFYKSKNIMSAKLTDNPLLKIGKYTFPQKNDEYCYFTENGLVDIKKTKIILAKNKNIKIGIYEIPVLEGTQIYFNDDYTLNFKKTKFVLNKNKNMKIGSFEIPVKKETVIYFKIPEEIDFERTKFQLSSQKRLEIRNRKLDFANDSELEFHNNKMLKKGYIPYDFQLKVGENSFITRGERDFYFNENGQIDFEKTHIILKNDKKITAGEIRLKFYKDQRLIFHENEVFKKGFIKDDTELNIGKHVVTIKGKRDIAFHDNGRIDFENTDLTLTKNLTLNVGLNVIPFLAETRIYFYDDNNIRQGVLAEKKDLKIWNYNLTFKDGKRLFFHKNGEIDSKRTEIFLFDDTKFKVGDNEINFKKGSRIYFYEEGRILKGKLASDTVLNAGKNSIPFSSSKNILFNKNGNIMEGHASRDAEIELDGQKLIIRKSSKIIFYESGNIFSCEIAKNNEIKTKNTTNIYKQYSVPEFWENGKLKKGRLAEDGFFEINGRKFAVNKDYEVDFNPDGSFKKGYLLEKTEFNINNNLLVLKKGRPIEFDSNGNIISGFLAEKTKYNINGKELILSSDTEIKFHENKKIKYAYLRSYSDFIINGQKITSDPTMAVSFHKNGNVKEILLLRNAKFKIGDNSIVFLNGTGLVFYENGNIRSGYPAKPVIFYTGKNKLVMTESKEISFYKNGRLRYANIKEKTQLEDGKEIGSGEWLYMDEAGNKGIINLFGLTMDPINLTAGDKKISIPEGSRVTFRGDDTLFKIIVPSQDIYLNDKLIATRGIELYYNELEKRIIGD